MRLRLRFNGACEIVNLKAESCVARWWSRYFQNPLPKGFISKPKDLQNFDNTGFTTSI